MWYQRYKMKKVKAGVLLYALLMAAIFSLLLQFYLHRQVAERRILKTSQERLRAYALVQLALEKRKSDEKTSEIHFLHAQAEMDGESYEFVLPVREEKESKKSQKEKKTRKDKAKAGSETPSEETPNEIKEPSENSEKD